MEGKITTASGDAIEIDFTAMEDRLDQKADARMQKYMTELKEGYDKTKDGKGVIETRTGGASKLIEQLQNIRNSPLTEQWNIVLPNYTAAEVAGHLRDYVYVTEKIKGAPGDVVNIPYVMDFDFSLLASVGATAPAETTGIINVLTTTLLEAAAWTDVEYSDIEKIDANLLDELNRVFAHAAVRAEDRMIVQNATYGIASASSNTQYAGNLNRGSSANAFYAINISRALGLLMAAGKDVHPGDCIVYMTAEPYTSLLNELTTSEVVARARSDIIQKGLIEEYLGVKIVVGGHTNSAPRTAGATGTCEYAFLMRAKRAVALAPKRDILIETDRQVAERELTVAGSHTAGVLVLDFKEIAAILCNTFDNTG